MTDEIIADHLNYLREVHRRMTAETTTERDFVAGILGATEAAHDRLAEAVGAPERLGPQSLTEAILGGLAPAIRDGRVAVSIVHLGGGA